MSDPIFAAAHAYLDDQLTITGDWDERQYITLELSDGHSDPGVCPMKCVGSG